jgi:hypothetical protein
LTAAGVERYAAENSGEGTMTDVGRDVARAVGVIGFALIVAGPLFAPDGQAQAVGLVPAASPEQSPVLWRFETGG